MRRKTYSAALQQAASSPVQAAFHRPLSAVRRPLPNFGRAEQRRNGSLRALSVVDIGWSMVDD